MYPYNNFSMWYPPLNGNCMWSMAQCVPTTASPMITSSQMCSAPSTSSVAYVPAPYALPVAPQCVPVQRASVSDTVGSAGVQFVKAEVPLGPVVQMALPPPYTNIVDKSAHSEQELQRNNGQLYEFGALYEGVVKRFNPDRGYGFIKATHRLYEDGGKKVRSEPIDIGDIFVHQSGVEMNGFRSLVKNGVVHFRVGTHSGFSGKYAMQVILLPQKVPKGSPDRVVDESKLAVEEDKHVDKSLSESNITDHHKVCSYDLSCTSDVTKAPFLYTEDHNGLLIDSRLLTDLELDFDDCDYSADQNVTYWRSPMISEH